MKLTFEFPATRPVTGRSHVGVVGSGDCEVLVEAPEAGAEDVAEVIVRTTVEGFDTIWRHTLGTFFARHPRSGRYRINDQGATPGVVSLRLLQAVAP